MDWWIAGMNLSAHPSILGARNSHLSAFQGLPLLMLLCPLSSFSQRSAETHPFSQGGELAGCLHVACVVGSIQSALVNISQLRHLLAGPQELLDEAP